MKNQRVAGLILAAHITLGAAVLLLSGCQSTKLVKKAPKPGDNVALAQGTPRPVNPAFNSGLTAPTRPTETDIVPTVEPGAVLEPVTPAPINEEYVVAKGDTLSSIARSHGITVVELRNANGLAVDTLSVGQKITIPSKATPATYMGVEGGDVPAQQQYVVVKGDTLTHIARMYGVSLADLKTANAMAGDSIHVGQKLNLPAGALAAPKWVAPAAPKHSVKASKFSYKVERGDTAGSIAARAGVKTQDLLDLNDISDPRKLRVGQSLKLPAGAKEISTKSVASTNGSASKGTASKGASSSAASSSGSTYSGANMLPTDIFAEPTAPVSSSETAPAPVSVQPDSYNTGSGLESLDAAPATPTVPVQGESY
jgi:LysM repeat protein